MRIGIIGAGQLGQMLGFAARDLDVEVRFVDPSPSPPAAVCGKVIQSGFDDPVALIALADTCDVITYEFENVPVEALQHIDGIAPVYPPASALRFSQDRVDEKQLFRELEIPLADFHAIDSRDDMDDAAEKLGMPLVIKTRRFGYDGKGQFVVRQEDDLDPAWAALGGQPLVAEQWIAFDYEISCIGVRSISGEIAIYPVSQNVHIDGILHTSRSP
jgi:5-(carboxyamino)imidazole ribonucleotide synthase